jgi:ribosome-binding protein aMBF1 (putative translation factor)
MSDRTDDDREPPGRPGTQGGRGAARRHGSVFPGFREMSERRRELTSRLAAERVELGLTQTEVAARMGTSQSAVARLESGAADVRISTLERYAAALDRALDLRLLDEPARGRDPLPDPVQQER